MSNRYERWQESSGKEPEETFEERIQAESEKLLRSWRITRTFRYEPIGPATRMAMVQELLDAQLLSVDEAMVFLDEPLRATS